MKLFKPWKITLYFILVSTMAVLVLLLLPDEGFEVADGITLRGTKVDDIFGSKKIPAQKLNPHVQLSTDNLKINEFLSHYLFYYQNQQIDFDSLKSEVNIRHVRKKIEKDSILYAEREKLHYPEAGKSVLYPFFDALKNVSKTKNEVIRVLHYGDSQIEGDRITSYIRNELQKQFGGYGVGLAPVIIASEYMLSYSTEIKGDWKRYNLFERKNYDFDHNRFGVLMSFCRFSPLLFSPNMLFEGTVHIKRTNMAYSNSKKFDAIKVFCGYGHRPAIVEIYKGAELFDAEIVLPREELQILEWKFDNAVTEILLKIKGEDSPNIYAISMESEYGVAVDNIPLRGSKGLDFTLCDFEFYKKMSEALNVKLILLQFGANVAPSVSSNFRYFEEQYYNQLLWLKKANPDACFIIIGISDMAMKTPKGYESYPNVKAIRDAQKNAAFRSGCVFWDTFEVMGGDNSMATWVLEKPPLATKDFVHFNFRGSKVIAQKFYNALINDYNNYIKQ